MLPSIWGRKHPSQPILACLISRDWALGAEALRNPWSSVDTQLTRGLAWPGLKDNTSPTQTTSPILGVWPQMCSPGIPACQVSMTRCRTEDKVGSEEHSNETRGMLDWPVMRNSRVPHATGSREVCGLGTTGGGENPRKDRQNRNEGLLRWAGYYTVDDWGHFSRYLQSL